MLRHCDSLGCIMCGSPSVGNTSHPLMPSMSLCSLPIQRVHTPLKVRYQPSTPQATQHTTSDGGRGATPEPVMRDSASPSTFRIAADMVDEEEDDEQYEDEEEDLVEVHRTSLDSNTLLVQQLELSQARIARFDVFGAVVDRRRVSIDSYAAKQLSLLEARSPEREEPPADHKSLPSSVLSAELDMMKRRLSRIDQQTQAEIQQNAAQHLQRKKEAAAKKAAADQKLANMQKAAQQQREAQQKAAAAQQQQKEAAQKSATEAAAAVVPQQGAPPGVASRAAAPQQAVQPEGGDPLLAQVQQRLLLVKAAQDVFDGIANDASKKSAMRAVKTPIQRYLNQVSLNAQVIAQKKQALIQHIQSQDSELTQMLAKIWYIKLVMNCIENQIKMAISNVFSFASVTVAVVDQFEGMWELMLGMMQKKRYCLIPIFQKRGAQESREAYLERIGASNEDNYLNVCVAYAAFFTAMCICGQGTPRIGLLWQYLSRLLNKPPSFAAPSVIEIVLRIGGVELLQAYGKQFRKLFQYIKQLYIPRCREESQTLDRMPHSMSIRRLEQLVESATKGTLAPVKGRDCLI